MILSRRSFVLTVPAALSVPFLEIWSGPAQAASTRQQDSYIIQCLNGLASYVMPGDDDYSRAQGLADDTPGGVAAGTAVMLEKTYDEAISVAVAPELDVRAPGAAGFGALLDLFTRLRYPKTPAFPATTGPFDHAFANLSWKAKGLVLADIDTQPLLQGSPLGFGFGTFITLAALGCYSEEAVWDPETRELTGIPVGWRRAKYGGVSDGWPELKGYWQGRESVTEVRGA